MRQVLHRSSLVMILFVTVAVLFTLGCSTVAEFYALEASPPDFLSRYALTVTVAQGDCPDPPVTVHDLLSFLSEQPHPVIVYRNHPISGSKEVFLSGATAFAPDIVEGRDFSATDFQERLPVALVSLDHHDACFASNDRLFLVHDGAEYAVIGTYSVPSSRQFARWGDTAGARYFVTMGARADGRDSVLAGEFILDAGTLSFDVVDAFCAHATGLNAGIHVSAAVSDMGPASHLVQAFRSSIMLLLAVALTVLLILLNAWSATHHWIEGRYAELGVRMLCGGTMPAIRRMVVRDYVGLVTLSYGLGLAAALVVIRSGSFPFLGRSANPLAAGGAYLALLILGTALGWVIISGHLRQSIVLQVRGVR